MKKVLILFMSLVMFLVPSLAYAAPNSTSEEKSRTETINIEDENYTITIKESGVIRRIMVTNETATDVAVLIENTKTGEKILNGKKVEFNLEEELHNQEPKDGDVSANLVPAPETGTTWSYYTTIQHDINLLTSGTALIGVLISIVQLLKSAGIQNITKTAIAISLAVAFLSGVSTNYANATTKIILYRRWYPEVKDYVYQFNNFFYLNGKSLGGFTWNAGYGW